MKVVSPYEELKSWFSLENYEQLKSLTIKELHTELAFREAIFDSVNFGWEDDNQNLRSILEGNPILSRQDNNHGHFGKGQRHVAQVSFGDIKKLENKLMMFSMDFFEENGDFKKELKKETNNKNYERLFFEPK
ncbi:DUF6387 family protein [Escherichia coli]